MSGSAQQLSQRAMAHLHAGRVQEAVAGFQQIANLFPRYALAPCMLGMIAEKQGQLPAALHWLDRAIELDPSFADSYFSKGLVFYQQRRLPEAVAAYRTFLTRRPNDGKGLNNLGRALLDQDQVEEATVILRQATRTQPPNPGAFSNLGEALRMAGDLEGAIEQYRKAVAINPNMAEGHGNLGIALYKLERLPESLISLRRAVAINPTLFNPRLNLAGVLQDIGRCDEALLQCQAALDIRPDSAKAHNLMGNLLGLMGRMPECIAEQRLALKLEPDMTSTHSNLLLSLNYQDDLSPAECYAAHRQWAKQQASNIPRCKPIHPPDRTDHRLRVGYVSPNFQTHSVARFFEPVLAAHDRSAVEIFCYSDAKKIDAVTERLRSLAEHWRDIADQSDESAATTIQQDRIDILIDLAGHTSTNRLPLFARKPAPIQMTWLGYPNTTGLSTMDYRITDAIADPPGEADLLHTEKLIRIEGGCWARQFSSGETILTQTPASTVGFVTFGSFNNLPKVTPKVLRAWGQILLRVPTSRLLLKSAGLSTAMGRDYVMKHFAESGIGTDRIELLAWVAKGADHLQLYDRVDIALDTFPYNGTTTTCEALACGVPVITFPGNTHVARVGASLLTHGHCPEWIAPDVEGYVALAEKMARDIEGLTSIRSTLRDRLNLSPLGDPTRLANALERAYLTAWVGLT